jgi:hypothetical protein
VNERVKIIREAEENINCIMGHKFVVSVSCIRDLRKKQDLLL